LKINKWKKIFKEIYVRFKDDEVPALGAELTYYLILAFFPFLIFLITLLSYTSVAMEDIFSYLSRLLPAAAYEIIVSIIQQTVKSRSETTLSLGMLFTLWAASNGILAFIRGLNKAYDQKETRPFWKKMIVSLFFTIGFALVILISFSMLVLGRVLGQHAFSFLGFSYFFNTAWDVIRYTTVFTVMMLVFICMYRCIPNRRLCLKEVIPGSVFSTVGWVVISLVFSYYVNNFANFSNMYGSLGGIFILLLWLYWSSIIILIGGEINATLAFNGKSGKHADRDCS